MDKIKILFTCASMNVGGAEKSLINLLNLMDYSKYDVDLILLQRQGAFLNQIPKEVKLMDLRPKAKALYESGKRGFKDYPMLLIKYISTMIEFVVWRKYDVLRAHRWCDVYSKICEKVEKEYDVVIAFQSGDSTYYAFDKVKGKRYVTFYHTDISNISLAKDIEKKYLEKADLVATISEKCVESVNNEFPEFKEKVICLENLSSKKLIEDLAGKEAPREFIKYENIFKIVSVGRLVKIKGYDMVVDAAKILMDNHVDFQWFIIGEGAERKALEEQIRKNNVESYVHLLGLHENPYPYMKYSNMIVQSSRYEGKSVVLDEAKIFGKHIIVTNYNSVEDQITNEIDGLICEMSAVGLADCLKKYMKNPQIIKNKQEVYEGDVVSYMNILVGTNK